MLNHVLFYQFPEKICRKSYKKILFMKYLFCFEKMAPLLLKREQCQKKKFNNFFSKFIQENGKKNVSRHKILNDFCFLCFSCKKTKSYLPTVEASVIGSLTCNFFQILSHCEISDGFGYPKLGFQVFTINERNGRILLDIR